MKKKLHLLFSLSFFALVFSAYAQVSSFPYVQDFEGPSVWQDAPASCVTTTSGATFSGWTQDPNDDGDWRADTAGTPSVGTGPGSGRVISGVGIGTDVNPGTIGGTYIYTEGSFVTGANPCSGSVINILSPYFDFSASGKYYKLHFNYHMLGATMGNLYIDVRSGTGSWSSNVWSQIGEKDSAWILDSVSLAAYNSDSVQIRIRAVMGSSWSSDIALDNFVIDTFAPPAADAVLSGATINNFEYPIIPLTQFDSLSFSGKIKNEGLQSVTNAKIAVTVSGYSGVISLGGINSLSSDSGSTSTKYMATSIGSKSICFAASISETESTLSNNYDTLSILVSDTVLARENLPSTTSGIGFNAGSGEIGQRFYINNTDSVTSATIYITNPKAGDSVRVKLRNYSGTPGSVIDSSYTITMQAGKNWYTAAFKCFNVLSPGDYFVAVEQLVAASNMSLGYTTKFFKPNTSYFGSSAGWTLAESANFSISELIRLNFGSFNTARQVSITASKDTVCSGESILVNGDKQATYSWAPNNLASAPTSRTTLFTIHETTTISVIASFGCGLTATDSTLIFAKKKPSSITTPDSTICTGQSITLTNSSLGNTYLWVNGPSNMNWAVTPATNMVYTVIVDSSNGCSNTKNIVITLNSPKVIASNDTSVCIGNQLTVTATGANSYTWLGGSNTASYTFNVASTGYKVVTGTNSLGCSAKDSVLITALASPTLTPLKDTGACFTNNIVLTAGATADNYLWSTGDTTKAITVQVLAAQTVSLKAFNNNGCTSYDTFFIDRYLKPNGTIDPDTTMCEGQNFVITAYGGSTYLWSNGEKTASITISLKKATRYDVIIYSDKGCEDYDDINVSVNPLPKSSFKYRDYEDSLVFTNESLLATSYSWSFGDGETSTAVSPYHIYDTTGDYTIKLTATNDCGSVDSSITIRVTVPKKTNSIASIAQLGEITLYPMPSFETLNYKLSNNLHGDIQISILNIRGKLLTSVVESKSSTELQGSIDISSLQAGLYLVRFDINGSSAIYKFIKKQ
jgi:PKD repeat protein